MVFQRRGLTDGLFPLREQPSFLSFMAAGSSTFPIPLVEFQKVVVLYPKQFVRQSSSATS